MNINEKLELYEFGRERFRIAYHNMKQEHKDFVRKLYDKIKEGNNDNKKIASRKV